MSSTAANTFKSGIVRRAELNVRKAELLLEKAHKELARQIELDVIRAKEREERKAAKKLEKKAERDANPDLVYLQTKLLLFTYCVEHNLRCTDEIVSSFIQWKKTIEFPPNTNRYQKATQFFQKKEEEIPIFAKTMTGELIPLVYHSVRNIRDLLLQLR
jgi:hypothetical protein